jgi:uncharacterized membrane protein
MTIKRLSLLVFFLLCALYVVQGIYYYPQLPVKVASHFGPSGQPDSWSTKSSFMMLYFGIIGVLSITLLGITFCISVIPDSLINLPNKEYWMSKDRKQEAFDFIFHYFLWFASATLLLIIDLSHQIFKVHIGKSDSLAHPMLSLYFYIGFVITWCIGFFIKFGKKVGD